MLSNIKPLFNVPIKNILKSTNNIEIEEYHLLDRTEEIKSKDLSFHNNNNNINKSNFIKRIYDINIPKLRGLGDDPTLEDIMIRLNLMDNNNNEENNIMKITKENAQINNNSNSHCINKMEMEMEINNNSEEISEDNNINEYYLNQAENFYNSKINKEFKRLTSVKAEKYSREKLYDIPINIKDLTVYTPPDKYAINEKYFAFIYSNDLNTYYITESGSLLNHKMNNYLKDKNEGRNHFNEKLGLYFCGENFPIQIEKQIYKRKCAPNEFICKECMEKNKKEYFINNDYLINIKGRVAKKIKGKFHCFGHFSNKNNNQKEDCTEKFTCEACKMLNFFINYYEK